MPGKDVTASGRRPSYPEVDAAEESEPRAMASTRSKQPVSQHHEAPSQTNESVATHSDQCSVVSKNQMCHNIENFSGQSERFKQSSR